MEESDQATVRWDEYAARWLRARLGYILLIIYMLGLCFAIPLSVNELVKRHAEKHVVVWFVAGVFVYMTIPITTAGVVQHLKNFSQPPQQLRLIRILMMVPVYSFFSYLGMILHKQTIYLDAMRECYESYVIYNFMMFLVTYMYEHYNVEQLLNYKAAQPQLFPFQRLPPWPKGKSFVIWSKRGVFVYVVSKPITTIIMLIAELAGHSGKNEFSIGSIWMWTLIIDNIAQMWALYCLVIFYQALKHELAGIEPLPKFLCVKAVVFFSFWQGLFLDCLVFLSIIKDSKNEGGYTAEETAETVQNLLICMEMFGFSIAHHIVFSYKHYVSEIEIPPPQFLTSLSHLFDFRDVRTDIRTQLGVSAQTIRNNYRSRHTERSPLLSSEHVELNTFKNYNQDSNENI
ncbi:transmembrane protein 184C-like isoform X2 [Bolinopsis microptera]|uniref:transmembrane protein 184C-like isoform X2 n=1 Tax=Bolinopsis microptera TaxID=2820187 RepID=UPI00307AAD5D